MITTDKFVFMHMHKTGGQSLGRLIEQCIPSFHHVGYHYPLGMLPAGSEELPVVGMVRNPWDWYLSWYAFNTRPGMANPLFFILSDGFQANYRQTIENLVNFCSDNPRAENYRKALIAVLPETLDGNRGVGLTQDDIRQIAGNGEGYYSWLFGRMHGDLDRKNLYIGRFENLQEEFLSIIRQLGVGEADRIEQAFNKNERVNASRHSHYSHYYDDASRELVASRESALIKRYDYDFETAESSEPTIAFPIIQIGGKNDGFCKLSGKENNYLRLKADVELTFIRRKLSRIPERRWHGSGRENTYEVHKQTQSLLLIHDADFRHYNPTYCDLYKEFRKELQPIFDWIANHYQHDGYIVRTLFARLSAHGKIDSHTDGLFSLLKCHRIHIPIITNEEVIFTIGGEDKHLREGEMWEINNATLHAVENRSDHDRIHLIIDWVPNATVRAEDKRPPVTATPKNTGASAMPNYNGRMVGRNEPCPCNSGKKFKHCHGVPR